MYSSFFCLCAGAHLELPVLTHSFPTRRVSDLLAPQQAAHGAARAVVALQVVERRAFQSLRRRLQRLAPARFLLRSDTGAHGCPAPAGACALPRPGLCDAPWRFT